MEVERRLSSIQQRHDAAIPLHVSSTDKISQARFQVRKTLAAAKAA
jgi:hypothetical protein